MPKSIEGVMKEFKHGELHSGSHKGPVVKSRQQAIAIAMSEQRERGHHKEAHGYGHKASQKEGHLRNSGHPKAHRIGHK